MTRTREMFELAQCGMDEYEVEIGGAFCGWVFSANGQEWKGERSSGEWMYGFPDRDSAADWVSAPHSVESRRESSVRRVVRYVVELVTAKPLRWLVRIDESTRAGDLRWRARWS